jgi:SAM-dependent methyltransferase
VVDAPRLEQVPCNLCGSEQSRAIFTSRDYRFQTDPTEFAVVRCRSCGLVRLNPRPIEEDIHRYYHDGFYRADETPKEALDNLDERWSGMAKHIARYPRGRLLDVGCYRGELMEHMRTRHGWSVAGIEFSQRPTNHFDLDIFYGDIARSPFPSDSFDVVTLWAVLEHVYNPTHVLQHVRRLLRPGGTCIILVPNFHSVPGRLLRHDDIPRHVTMFTRRTLARLLAKCGLQPVEWSCDQDVYGGSVRGCLNFLVKRMAGESMGEILAQNRPEGADRWHEFSSQIKSRDSALMRRVDAVDNWLAPRLDRVLDTLGLGFTMTVHARSVRRTKN